MADEKNSNKQLNDKSYNENYEVIEGDKINKLKIEENSYVNYNQNDDILNSDEYSKSKNEKILKIQKELKLWRQIHVISERPICIICHLK